MLISSERYLLNFKSIGDNLDHNEPLTLLQAYALTAFITVAKTLLHFLQKIFLEASANCFFLTVFRGFQESGPQLDVTVEKISKFQI